MNFWNNWDVPFCWFGIFTVYLTNVNIRWLVNFNFLNVKDRQDWSEINGTWPFCCCAHPWADRLCHVYSCRMFITTVDSNLFGCYMDCRDSDVFVSHIMKFEQSSDKIHVENMNRNTDRKFSSFNNLVLPRLHLCLYHSVVKTLFFIDFWQALCHFSDPMIKRKQYKLMCVQIVWTVCGGGVYRDLWFATHVCACTVPITKTWCTTLCSFSALSKVPLATYASECFLKVSHTQATL